MGFGRRPNYMSIHDTLRLARPVPRAGTAERGRATGELSIVALNCKYNYNSQTIAARRI